MSKKKNTLNELLEEALVPEDEQPYELPENWIWTRLGTLFEHIKLQKDPDGSESYIGLEHLQKGGGLLKIGNAQDLKSKKVVFQKGDLLYGKLRPYLNKHYIAEFDGIASTDILVYRISEEVYTKFINSYLNISFVIEYANSNSSGINLPRISPSVMNELPVPLPPVYEFEKIVSKIEILFAKLDKAIQLIEETKKAFEVRRATILDKVLKNLETESNIVTLADLVEFQNGLSKRSGKVGEEVIVLRLADIKDGDIDLSDSRKIMLTDNEREKYGLNKNDILFIRVNGSRKLVGTAIVVELESEMAFCDHLIRGALNKDKVTESFIKYIFESNYVRSQIEGKIVSSAGQNTISQKSLSEIKVPLPSIEKMNEATEYLDKVYEQESLSFKKIESINLKAIQQSILSKAFKGELGTNDPTDEPAVELLKSILQEKL